MRTDTGGNNKRNRMEQKKNRRDGDTRRGIPKIAYRRNSKKKKTGGMGMQGVVSPKSLTAAIQKKKKKTGGMGIQGVVFRKAAALRIPPGPPKGLIFFLWFLCSFYIY
jgi:hypothetical protein